jgi:abhydrolase domain-containing protein 17
VIKTLILTLLGGIICYFALALFLHFFARALIYVPPRPGYVDDHNIIKLRTKDNAIISAIYLKNPTSKYTVLISHGNAEDIGYMMPFLQAWQQHGFTVLAYDYQSYGTSTGTSTETNSYAAIAAAYDYLTKNLHTSPQKIILYGRSLGAAIALDLAVKQKAAAIIMESPFVSAYRVVTHFPLFIFDQFKNIDKISQLTIPLFIIHGTHDNIVPTWHGMKLYEAASVTKQHFWVRNAGHNDLYWTAKEKYWQEIGNFVKLIGSCKSEL